MVQEKYDPEKHCCDRWYKDYCTCVKEEIKESRKKSRDRNVNATLKFLKKNQIEFVESKINNVVVVNPETDHTYVSLKKIGSLIQCRFKGSNKWYTYSKPKFVEKFGPSK